MTIEFARFDEENNVNIYVCTVCKTQYGTFPEEPAVEFCENCRRIAQVADFKRRITEAQVAAITLQRAILAHKLKVEQEFDATPADDELWATLETVHVPNDSPQGIIGYIE